MGAVSLIMTGISVVRGLAGLAVDVAPLIGNLKTTIDSLRGKGHVTEEQATDLHAKTAELEGEWAELLKKAREEG